VTVSSVNFSSATVEPWRRFCQLNYCGWGFKNLEKWSAALLGLPSTYEDCLESAKHEGTQESAARCELLELKDYVCACCVKVR
jgi:hypothetical protein